MLAQMIGIGPAETPWADVIRVAAFLAISYLLLFCLACVALPLIRHWNRDRDSQGDSGS